jgi:SAM-dependent methyltransferase
MRGLVLPGGDQRAEARRLYGADPLGYEQGRPDYPDRVYELLQTRCGLRPGTTVVEIGPGTGRVTERLTRLGARVVGVEPDPALAAYLRDRMAGTGTDVLAGTFEDASLAEGGYDLAVAAMSFHWLAQDVALPKLGRIVRPGGSVALWWTVFGDPSRPDPFHDATHQLIDRPAGREHADRPPFELDEAGWRHALARGAGLVDVDAELIRWTARLDTDALRALYGSMIAVRRRPEPERRALLDELVRRALSDFGGVIERPFVTAMYTARRPDDGGPFAGVAS